MKALTVSQPYASLIADGLKWVENRTWYTPYRGRLAIHAGKGLQYLKAEQLAEYPNGCVIAICDLLACFRLVDLPQLGSRLESIGFSVAAVRDHKHAEGPWCWLLGNVVKLREPRPCRGAQGLWEWLAGAERQSELFTG